MSCAIFLAASSTVSSASFLSILLSAHPLRPLICACIQRYPVSLLVKPSLLPQVGQKKIGQATPLFVRTLFWLVNAFSFAFRNNSSDIIGSCAFSTTIHSSLSLETNLLLPVLATLFLFQIIFPRYTSFLSISEIVVTDQSFFSFSFSLCIFIPFLHIYSRHVSTWVSFRYFAICPLVFPSAAIVNISFTVSAASESITR